MEKQVRFTWFGSGKFGSHCQKYCQLSPADYSKAIVFSVGFEPNTPRMQQQVAHPLRPFFVSPYNNIATIKI